MQAKNKNTFTKAISKNQLFKKKIILRPDDLKEKLRNLFESKNETIQSNYQYNKMLRVLFDENKFKIRNDFDRKHSKEFLYEKDKCLRPIGLDDYLFDDDEKIETLNKISSKFTFGHN